MSVEMTPRPVVVIACRVFESSLCKWFGAPPVTFLDQGLHDTPKKLLRAIQAALDALPEPAVVLIGYGLCGNGLHGLQSGRHTLIIPRADDCIAIYLGSQAARRQQLEADPGVYFLTIGWLEGANNPMSNYEKQIAAYGKEQADWLLQTMYGHYSRLVFIASSEEELAAYRPRAQAIADFAREHLGWSYEERLGSDEYLRRLLDAPQDPLQVGDGFLLVLPGNQVTQGMFIAL